MTLIKLILIQFVIYWNFFSILPFEFDEFKLNSTNECNIIDDEYCVHKPLKDDCTVTIISPYTCANQQNETSCDLILDWNIIDDHVVKFTLTKYKYQMNEWIALIFSNSNISNTEVNSDIIITLLPMASNPRILNGIIKGSDVILVDDLEEIDLSLSNYSDKKLLHENISFSDNFVDIEFSFKYTSKNSINLNECSASDDTSKGFYMFLMSGKLDKKFNILFETATIPKIFGPFCLNSCSKNQNFSENKLAMAESFILKNQEKKQTNSLKNNSVILNTETLSNESITIINESSVNIRENIKLDTSTIFTSTSSIVPKTSQNMNQILTTNLHETNISLNTTTSVNYTSNLPIYTTEIFNPTLISESLEFDSTELNEDLKTNSQEVNSQSMILTDDPVTNQDITRFHQTQTISTISSTFTSSTIKFCSNQVENLSNFSLEFIYDYRVETYNYTLKFNLNYYFTRIGIFNINLEKNNETLLLIAETNQTYSNITKNTNESDRIESSINENTIIFSIPRDVKLTNDVFMKDCQNFNFYFGNDSQIDIKRFISNPSANSLMVSKVESVCLESCSDIDKTRVNINLKFNVNNYFYHSDLEDLNSEKTKNLSKNIIEIFKTALNEKFDNFVIINILKAINKKKSWKRQIMADIIIIESKLTVWSQNSQKYTENNVMKILSESTAFSHLYQIDGFSVIESFSEKTSTSIQTTTIAAIDDSYPKVLALSLVFSLLITVLVLGGALFAYHRWQKSKENSPNRGFRLAIPNRRVNYEAQMVDLDSSLENKITNGIQNLEFTNPAFEEVKKEGLDSNFTDFTGSREMGIDIGTLEENLSKQPVIMEEINEKQDDFKNLRNILYECLKTETKRLSDDFKNAENFGSNLYRTSNCENLKIQDDDMNFDYFNENNKNSQYTADSTNDSLELLREKENESEKYFDSCDEKTEDVAIIFSKSIEQNLPELFGQYLNEEIPNEKTPNKIQLDQESLQSVPKDSLNISTDEPSDEDEDFKPIDKNAFKNFRVGSNRKFVIDEKKSSFKELIKQQSESFENNSSFSKDSHDKEKFSLEDKSKELDNLKFISTGIAEFSTPRVCKIRLEKGDLGIHFCDSRNNMILDVEKNSPADLAGVKPGDKILFIDDVNVEKSTCDDIRSIIDQVLANSDNVDVTLIVMNAIEYSIFKSNEFYHANDKKDKNTNSLETKINKESNSKDLMSDIASVRCQSEAEFNPFDDIPNEMITPFLHYSSIPPPDTFQKSNTKMQDFDQENMRDDSLEESTSETISSCVDTRKNNDNSQNNLNDFDFISNFTSTTDVNNDSILNPSNIFFQENSQFKTPWSTAKSEKAENVV